MMNNVRRICTLALVFLAAVAPANTAAEFTEITDGVDQSITGINIDSSCNDGKNGNVPNTMWTIGVSDNITAGVTVETSPANLFIVSSDGNSGTNTLSFKWNYDVASSASEGGGVKITVPADQLQSVTVRNGSNTQILDGFTSVTSLKTSDGATLRATFTSSTATDFTLDNSDGATMYVKSNVPITGGSVWDGASSTVATPSYNNIDVSDGAALHVDGDAVGTGSVGDDGRLKLSGTITGSIAASDGGTVKARNCDGVTSSDGGSCTTEESTSVAVEIFTQDDILSGSSKCYGYGLGFIGGLFGGNGGGSSATLNTNTNSAFAAVTATAAATVVVMLI